MGNDLDLAIALLGDDDVVAQVVGAALDLDAVLEELLKGRDVEDLVVGGLRSVDDVLQARLVSSQHWTGLSNMVRRPNCDPNVPSWSASGPCQPSSVEEIMT